MLTKLKIKDWLTIAGVIIIGFGWLLVDQIFLSESYQRFIALLIILLGLLFLQFVINKPATPFRYANTIALICVSFIVVISIIVDLIVKHNYTLKSVLIWIIAAVLPYISAFIYSNTRQKKKK